MQTKIYDYHVFTRTRRGMVKVKRATSKADRRKHKANILAQTSDKFRATYAI